MAITYKNLYTLVDNLIKTRVGYNTGSSYGTQESHANISPFVLQSTGGDISLNILVQSMM